MACDKERPQFNLMSDPTWTEAVKTTHPPPPPKKKKCTKIPDGHTHANKEEDDLRSAIEKPVAKIRVYNYPIFQIGLST